MQNCSLKELVIQNLLGDQQREYCQVETSWERYSYTEVVDTIQANSQRL